MCQGCRGEASTYVAHFAKVAVDSATGVITVERVDCVVDCGLLEGSIVLACSPTLKEAVEFSNGIVTNPTFGQYNPLRLNEAPREIVVDFVEDKANPMGGIGEPAVARGARLTRKTSTEGRPEKASTNFCSGHRRWSLASPAHTGISSPPPGSRQCWMSARRSRGLRHAHVRPRQSTGPASPDPWLVPLPDRLIRDEEGPVASLAPRNGRFDLHRTDRSLGDGTPPISQTCSRG